MSTGLPVAALRRFACYVGNVVLIVEEFDVAVGKSEGDPPDVLVVRAWDSRAVQSAAPNRLPDSRTVQTLRTITALRAIWPGYAAYAPRRWCQFGLTPSAIRSPRAWSILRQYSMARANTFGETPSER